MTTTHPHTAAEPITREERIAAAQVIVTINKRLGTDSEQWVIDLAEEGPDRLAKGA
ncbi:hypothetical protein [Pseudactinotalea sp. Z1748]|uniref:hypothetical protein n=1 Tax=Pseudactinotalea sp. Z1748 TaxID=3413027 RepID=UPI003C7E4075